MPIYEPLFSDGSYGYRPGRSAKDAIQKIKEYAEKGYTRAVVLDLSKYFDTIDHVKLLNLLRQNVKDERVIQMIKRYLKSGVMEDGVVVPTVEGSPQGSSGGLGVSLNKQNRPVGLQDTACHYHICHKNERLPRIHWLILLLACTNTVKAGIIVIVTWELAVSNS